MIASRLLVLAAFGAAALLASAAPAFAACGTLLNPMLVTATAVSFGLYDPGAAMPDTANGSVVLDCVLNDEVPSFDATISSGLAPDFTPRRMVFLLSSLDYNIYTDSSYGTVWGDGTDGSEVRSYTESTGVGIVTLTAFGAIPTGQFVAPGLYLDTLTVQITF